MFNKRGKASVRKVVNGNQDKQMWQQTKQMLSSCHLLWIVWLCLVALCRFKANYFWEHSLAIFLFASASVVVLNWFYHSSNFSVDFQIVVMFTGTRDIKIHVWNPGGLTGGVELESLADEDGEMLRMRLLRWTQLIYTHLPKWQLYSLLRLVHQQCFFFLLEHPFHEAELGGKAHCCMPACIHLQKSKKTPQNLEEFLSRFLVSLQQDGNKKCFFLCWKEHGKNNLQPGPDGEEGSWCWAPGCSQMANSSAGTGDARLGWGKHRAVNDLWPQSQGVNPLTQEFCVGCSSGCVLVGAAAVRAVGAAKGLCGEQAGPPWPPGRGALGDVWLCHCWSMVGWGAQREPLQVCVPVTILTHGKLRDKAIALANLDVSGLINISDFSPRCLLSLVKWFPE